MKVCKLLESDEMRAKRVFLQLQQDLIDHGVESKLKSNHNYPMLELNVEHGGMLQIYAEANMLKFSVDNVIKIVAEADYNDNSIIDMVLKSIDMCNISLQKE